MLEEALNFVHEKINEECSSGCMEWSVETFKLLYL